MEKIKIESTGSEFKIFVARLKAVTPLLMHNPQHSMGGGNEASRKKVPTPEEEAERGLYRHPDGWLYLGADHVREAMKRAAKGLRVNRKPLGPILAAAVFVLEEYFPITRNGQTLTTYDRIDVRRAVVQKQGILRARPLIETPWEAEVRYQYDAGIIQNPGILVQVLQEAGTRIGVLDYRPEKGGPFGRFEIVEAWVEDL
jgi:hypothetical protein